MTTHAYLALVACPHGSGGVFFCISGGLRGRGGSLPPKGDKCVTRRDDFCAIFRLSRREFLTRTLALGAVAAATSSGALCKVLRGNSKQGSIESKRGHFCSQW